MSDWPKEINHWAACARVASECSSVVHATLLEKIAAHIVSMETQLEAATENPIQINLGAGDIMISHIKWVDAQGISFAPMPDGYTGIGLNVDDQVAGKTTNEISATVVIKSSSIESLKVLRDAVQMAIAGFTVKGE